MKYQQASLTRLSAAGKKLVNDGRWHRFESDGRQWYRVRGRTVQRVTLLSAADDTVFEEFREIEPLHPHLFREGFREEISIERSARGFAVADVLLRSFPRWEEIAAAMAEEGVEIGAMGSNTLSVRVHFARCAQEELAGALLKLKAFAIAAAEWGLMGEEHPPRQTAPFLSLFALSRNLVEESIDPSKDPHPSSKFR